MKGPPTRRAGGPITGNPGGPITLAKSAHTGPKLLANDSRESNPSQEAPRTAETQIVDTRNNVKRRGTTCGYAGGFDGINTRGASVFGVGAALLMRRMLILQRRSRRTQPS